jgi:hypothetical protein
MMMQEGLDSAHSLLPHLGVRAQEKEQVKLEAWDFLLEV